MTVISKSGAIYTIHLVTQSGSAFDYEFTHNFRRNNKGIGTVFGMVFFLLIVMIVFASFMIISKSKH